MTGFLARRLTFGLAALAALSFVSFVFFASQGGTEPTGRPILSEYGSWLRGLAGGESWARLTQPLPRLRGGPPTTMLDSLGHTFGLLLFALVLVLVFSVAVALAAATRRRLLDGAVRAVSYVAWGIPAFLLALVVQLLVDTGGSTRGIGPFPLAGWPGACPPGIGLDYGTLGGCPAAGSGLHYLASVLRYLTLPAATLAIGFVGLHGRYLRTALLDTLGAPFVTTARAKGLPERRVIFRHALRASLVTFVGALSADFGAVFGAAMAVDWIFQLNGLGTALLNEFPLNGPGVLDTYSIVLMLVLTGALVIASSIVGELAVGALDPRVLLRR